MLSFVYLLKISPRFQQIKKFPVHKLYSGRAGHVPTFSSRFVNG